MMIEPPARRQPAAMHLVNEWLSKYLGSTAYAYGHAFDTFLQWWTQRGGSVDDCLAATVTDAREYMIHLAETRHLSSATINQHVSALSSFWADAGRTARAVGRVLLNPWDGHAVRRPPVRDGRAERTLTEGDMERLIAAAETPAQRALVLLLYDTGIRVSEAVLAQWRHVTTTPYGRQLSVLGKGGKTRLVGLSDRAHDALRGVPRGPDGWMLPGKHGGHIDRYAARREIRRVTRRAGLEQAISPHWIRHAAASHALWHGADLATVQHALGHVSASITARYLHSSPERTLADYIPGATRTRRQGADSAPNR